METEWRAIVGYEGIYEASSDGNIRRIAPAIGTHVGRVLRTNIIKSGYRMALLCRAPHDHAYVRVCRVIALAFYGAPPTHAHQVNHRNGQKADDRTTNLEWVTPSENCRHAYRDLGIKKPRGNAHHNSRLTEEMVREARRLVAQGETHRQIANRFSVARCTISAALRGQNWAHVA